MKLFRLLVLIALAACNVGLILQLMSRDVLLDEQRSAMANLIKADAELKASDARLEAAADRLADADAKLKQANAQLRAALYAGTLHATASVSRPKEKE